MILELLAIWFSKLGFEYSSKPLNIYDEHPTLEDMKALGSLIILLQRTCKFLQDFVLGHDNTTMGKINKTIKDKYIYEFFDFYKTRAVGRLEFVEGISGSNIPLMQGTSAFCERVHSAWIVLGFLLVCCRALQNPDVFLSRNNRKGLTGTQRSSVFRQIYCNIKTKKSLKLTQFCM